MKFLKGLISIIIYFILGITYLLSLFLENKKLFYGLTIIIVFILLYAIIKNGYLLKKNKNKRIFRVGIIVVNTIFLAFTFMWVYAFKNIDEINKILTEEYLASFETEEYNSQFIETNYKKHRIIHKDNLQAALPMINRYLGEIELKCKEIFGDMEDNLTIKFDYDKDVFYTRLNNGHEVAAGYYVPGTNIIYMYAEDAYDILINKRDFNGILFHEFTHYYYDQYLESNNVNDKWIPAWFAEGISDYVSRDEACIDSYDLKFIPFDNIKDSAGWNSIESGEQYIQSFYAISKLVELKGKNVINDLIINIKEDNFNSVFEEVVGMTLNNFEEIIKKDIENSKNKCDELHNAYDYKKYEIIKLKGLEEYLKTNTDNIYAYQVLSNFYVNDGKVNEAIKLLKRGIELNPDDKLLKISLEMVLNGEY